MSRRSDYFARAAARVDLKLFTGMFVVVAGAGSVGSMVTQALAQSGVGHLVLADGDRLEVHNLFRHVLPDAYVGCNKAEALAAHLRTNVAGADVGALAHHLDESFTDAELDRLLAPADLVVITTDRLAAQRRIAARCLAMDKPAVIPGLYTAGGGEVFVQLRPGEACYRCYDNFRSPDAEVRGASSVAPDALDVVQQAVHLCLAVLDPRLPEARDLAPGPGERRPQQLFIVRHGEPLRRVTVPLRNRCPGCAVGPSALAGQAPAHAAADALAGRAMNGRDRPEAAGWPFVLTGDAVAPTIEEVAVSDGVIVEGETVTLSWRTRNATSVRIDGHGTHPPRGKLEVSVPAGTRFRVYAVNPFGETRTLSPAVRTVPLPRLVEIAVPVAEGVAPFAVPTVGAETSTDVVRSTPLDAPLLRGHVRQVPLRGLLRVPARSTQERAGTQRPARVAVALRELRQSLPRRGGSRS
jgi:molybdopterin/thiamine biosynthesis adenylyltransferase